MNNRVKKNKFLSAVTNLGTWIANLFYLQLDGFIKEHEYVTSLKKNE